MIDVTNINSGSAYKIQLNKVATDVKALEGARIVALSIISG